MTLASEPLGVAVIGGGRVAGSHLDAIQACPDFGHIVAVADTNLDRAAAAAALYGAQAFDNLQAVLALGAVQAVVLCTPNHAHAEQSIAALNAGKHVLVEKPMADTEAEARGMVDATEQSGRVLAIANTFRHGATTRYIQDHRADFGTLRALEVSHCVFWDGPQTAWWATRTPHEGLILSMFAPHALDFVHMMMGDAPLRVYAESARHQDGWLAEDELMILMAYPGQRMASIHLSYNQPRTAHRKVAAFDRGMLRIEDGEYLYWNDELMVKPGGASAQGEEAAGQHTAFRDQSYFGNQFKEFIRATRGWPNRSVLHTEGFALVKLLDRVRAASLQPTAAT